MSTSDKMKLRNKKTGEISEFYEIYLTKTVKETNTATSEYVERAFYSISDLQDEFEDYKPAEPLIKDEKIRKAVRAWAEACGVDRVVNGEYDNELCAKGQQFYGAKIVLTKTVALPRGRNYTIAELCGEEEDYEEPKTFYHILSNGGVIEKENTTDDLRKEFIEDAKKIGNYFETKEEAEKVVEKLKAWKRLKDNGFRFTDWNCPCRELEFAVDENKFFKASGEVSEETRADLDLLFGGGEE